MASFATADDLEASWRPFSDDGERVRAERLLERASRAVRAAVPGIDLRIGNPDDAGYVDAVATGAVLDPMTVNDVVCAMVQRVLSSGVPGAETLSNTVGAVSVAYKFSNPMGDLYLTRAELALLQAASVSSGAFSISTFPVC